MDNQSIYAKMAAILRETKAITKSEKSPFNKGKLLDELENYIRKYFSYDAKSGMINRNDRKGGIGSLDAKGYLILKIKGKQFKAHRIAWFLYYGKMPEMEIDHINKIRTDNRICNLRIATRGENNRNRKQAPNKDTGFIGIHPCRHYKKMLKNFETRYKGKLYKFYTIEEAVQFRKLKGLSI